MIDQDVDSFLEHFGVKGMKWGIRKKSSTPRKTSADHKKIASLRKKPASSLSNNELKILNERLNLEQNFNRLNPGKVSNGKKRAEMVLGTVGVAVTAYNLLNSPAGKAFKNIGRRATNRQLRLF